MFVKLFVITLVFILVFCAIGNVIFAVAHKGKEN